MEGRKTRKSDTHIEGFNDVVLEDEKSVTSLVFSFQKSNFFGFQIPFQASRTHPAAVN